MRLPCDVEIQNRMFPSHGIIKKGRTMRASLVIGRRPLMGDKDGAIFLAICTAKDRDGAKYCLKGNVVKIFGRFVQEGKATVRIHDPAQDVCISKADPLQLKTFLMAVNMAHRNQTLTSSHLSSLVPAKASQVERPKTNVVIQRRQDYPITTGFPKTMETLQINGCSLKRVDSRILEAKWLRSLDMTSNNLTAIPDTLGQLRNLSELNVSHNKLTSFPVGLCVSNIAKTLQCLNLSHNSIKQLPYESCYLTAIIRLDVSHNELELLPENIGSLMQLRFLNGSYNQLRHVPSSFRRLRLDELDLSGNRFTHSNNSSVTTLEEQPLPSLLELAGRAVITHKVPFQEGDIPVTLCYYLSPSRWHWCFHGIPISAENQPHGTFIMPLNLSRLAHSVTTMNFQRRLAPVDMRGYLCSVKCQRLFLRKSAQML